MKALIIGGGGFVGRYLAEHLLQDCGWETIVTKLPKETVEVEGCEAYNLDILDKDAVEALLVRRNPASGGTELRGVFVEKSPADGRHQHSRLPECAGRCAGHTGLFAEDSADRFR